MRDLYAYEGKRVSLDYHVPIEIIIWIENVGRESKAADIVIIEIGVLLVK
jgi:CTP synthase (UTP-ammonia lyase)